LFGPLKQNWGGRRFYHNGEVNVVIYEWLRMKETYLCRDGIFKLVSDWQKCINIFTPDFNIFTTVRHNVSFINIPTYWQHWNLRNNYILV
jgi:hypothetical protein